MALHLRTVLWLYSKLLRGVDPDFEFRKLSTFPSISGKNFLDFWKPRKKYERNKGTYNQNQDFVEAKKNVPEQLWPCQVS